MYVKSSIKSAGQTEHNRHTPVQKFCSCLGFVMPALMKSIKVKITSLTPSRRYSKAQAAVIELCPNHL